jgi:hypothetical protein
LHTFTEMFRPLTARSIFCGVIIAAAASTVTASPTMVRLGYAQCSACHLTPQGSGLLTDYGKGIDEAQSLRAGEYQAPDQPRVLRYDFRALPSLYSIDAAPSGYAPAAPTWLRGYFRNSTALGAHNRIASTVMLESPPGGVSRAFDTRPGLQLLAAWDYKRSDAFTFTAARERIPRGVELGETRTILQDLDRDPYPAQVKAFFATSRFHVTTYAYGPGSSDAYDRRSRGAGVLGEVMILNNHMVLGASTRRAYEQSLTRQIYGAYTRFGFGRWGVLAEHELTARTATGLESPASTAFTPPPRRYAGYTQFFFYPKEWLATSIIGEQADDGSAAHTRTFRWRPEIQARLTPNITITASARNDFLRGVEGSARMYLVQIAVKTVQ